MEIYLPKSAKSKKIKYLAIAAHKDDVELMALDGILKADVDGGFAAVVLTDGGACPRAKGYEDITDEDMAEIRTAEQKRAAEVGGYSKLVLLEETSGEVKSISKKIVENIAKNLTECEPLEALYIHNPFDRHKTHIAALKCVIEAVRMLKTEQKPKNIYGCEVWRDLDWLPQEFKVIFDVSGGQLLAEYLFRCFESQNAAKNYGKGFSARTAANATFSESHIANSAEALLYAVDLTSLINDLSSSRVEDLNCTDNDCAEFAVEKKSDCRETDKALNCYVKKIIDRFEAEVIENF